MFDSSNKLAAAAWAAVGVLIVLVIIGQVFWSGGSFQSAWKNGAHPSSQGADQKPATGSPATGSDATERR